MCPLCHSQNEDKNVSISELGGSNQFIYVKHFEEQEKNVDIIQKVKIQQTSFFFLNVITPSFL